MKILKCQLPNLDTIDKDNNIYQYNILYMLFVNQKLKITLRTMYLVTANL